MELPIRGTPMMVQDIWVPLGLVLAVTSIFLLLTYKKKFGSGKCYNHLPLPPSPSGAWPILGHLPLLGTLPHRSLNDLAKKYGPVMYMRFGYNPVVVVSSSDMLREFFQVNDVIMASRPHYLVNEILGFNSKDVLSRPYGDRWRDIRKLFAQELLSTKRLNELEAMRRKEVLYGVQTISYRSKQSVNASVNLKREFREITFNITTQMLSSKRYFEANTEINVNSEISEVIDETSTLFGTFEVGDYIPFLKRFDLFGNIRRMRETNARCSRMIDNMFLEHKRGNVQRTDGVKDFVDTLLELQERGKLDDDDIKGLIMDFLLAGIETSSTALEWLMAELQVNPKAFKEVQKELDEVVGRNRIVSESDLPNLKYLQACVKESMRLHPTLPLLFPHESTASCTIGGYYIPAKTTVYVNLTPIHLNPATYEDPDKFIPERFLESGPNSQVDVKGQHFDLVPFGTGRRICMAMNMGLLMVQLGGAMVMEAYDWKLPADVTPGSLDLSEKFVTVSTMKVPLYLVPTPRLPIHVYAAENIEI